MRKTDGMTVPALDALLARIVDSGLLDEPVAKDGLVHARATVDAARTAVTVTVDPEFEDHGDDVDEDALLEAMSRILSVKESRWRAVVDEVAAEIEDAVDERDTPVIESIDLRDDMEATSVVVFADAVLLAFDAPRQFPDSRILVQLDEELEVADIEVRAREGGETT